MYTGSSRATRAAPFPALLLLPLVMSCSARTSGDAELDTTTPNDHPVGANSASSLRLPPPPSVAPRSPDLSDLDQDGDRIDDQLEADTGSQPVAVEVMLRSPSTQAQLAAFVRRAGTVRHVFASVSYGWTGSIPRAALAALRGDLGAELHFIAAPHPMALQLDEATRTGRVRAVWGPDFGGSPSGISGDPDTTIGIIDTGVDATHPDLSGRMAGFHDYSADANSSPRDAFGHGTHVASIALGSGAAFGLGPGALRYTNSGDLSVESAGNFLPAPIHTPHYFGVVLGVTASVSAVWTGGATTSLSAALAADADSAWSKFAAAAGASPQAIANANDMGSQARYSDALAQPSPAGVSSFAVANTVAGYPGAGDAFNAFSGVAPNCRWFDAKVFNDQGAGTSLDTAEAIDDLVTSSSQNNIQILNLSVTSNAGTDAALRAKVNTAVDNGLVVVIAAGNGGPLGPTPDPGRANEVITVGATNDLNELTSYTSIGAAPTDASEDFKPDILAPGGSSFRSLLMAADSNTADAERADFADLEPDDYTGMQGTSMSTPFVAGTAALMIDAWQRSGKVWHFGSSNDPLLIKMRLLAWASEPNVDREPGVGDNPSLGRAESPKDPAEGFGLVNADAAVESIAQALPGSLQGSVSGSSPARAEWERRVWGRHVALHIADSLQLTLTVPATADLDLYFYAGAPDANGAPMMRASSAHAGVGVAESIAYTASATETAYVFVKRISGYGDFTLSAVLGGTCGNGTLDLGEACDPSVAGSAACCDSACQSLNATTLCDDGNACTRTDHCQAGRCTGADAVACPAASECQLPGICNPSTGLCSTQLAQDGAVCSGGICKLGACEPNADGGAGAGAGGASVGAGGEASPSPGDANSNDGEAGQADLGGAAGRSGAGAGATASAPSESSDCSCKLAGAPDHARAAWWGPAAWLLAVTWRRRANVRARQSSGKTRYARRPWPSFAFISIPNAAPVRRR